MTVKEYNQLKSKCEIMNYKFYHSITNPDEIAIRFEQEVAGEYAGNIVGTIHYTKKGGEKSDKLFYTFMNEWLFYNKPYSDIVQYVIFKYVQHLFREGIHPCLYGFTEEE